MSSTTDNHHATTGRSLELERAYRSSEQGGPETRVRARPSYRPEPRRVMVIVPAHNEEQMIASTVRSLFMSEYRPDRVLVMADNCTDDTVNLARGAGAEVHETVDNTSRKAGAINQALDMSLASLSDEDIVMTMDADGVLAPDCIGNALRVFEERENVGGVCAAATSRHQDNFIEAAQAIEYAKGRRITSRRRGSVFVLSGCSTFIPARVLREVASARGSRLPGERGQVFVENSLVEDYELTLAVKSLGYNCYCSKKCNVETDLMPNIDEFETQRMRWLRGTFETLALYGWKPYTRRTFITISFNMFAFLLLPIAIVLLVFGYMAYGGAPTLWPLLLTPIFMIENIMVAHKIPGWRPKVLAYSFFPMWLYDMAQAIIYWRSLIWAVTNRSQKW